MQPAYCYRVDEVLSVTDGDTLTLRLDLGFYTFVKATVRLYGINCPERNTLEGKAVKQWVEDWINGQGNLTVETIKDKREKYGRMLAKVYGTAGELLNQTLVEKDFATLYEPGH